jgi:hypothetical protein
VISDDSIREMAELGRRHQEEYWAAQDAEVWRVVKDAALTMAVLTHLSVRTCRDDPDRIRECVALIEERLNKPPNAEEE